MNVFKWCWKHSFLGITTSLFIDLHQYKKDKRLISDTLYGDAFKVVLKKYLKTDFSKDWLGRLYGVVNPNIDNGQFDFNSIIIEIDGDNTNNSEYVKNWVFKQLKLISTLFKIEKLYDYIDIDFEHVGPVEYDNYLVIFDIVSRKVYTQSLKRFLKRLVFLIILAVAVLFGLYYFFPAISLI